MKQKKEWRMGSHGKKPIPGKVEERVCKDHSIVFKRKIASDEKKKKFFKVAGQLAHDLFILLFTLWIRSIVSIDDYSIQ